MTLFFSMLVVNMMTGSVFLQTLPMIRGLLQKDLQE